MWGKDGFSERPPVRPTLGVLVLPSFSNWWKYNCIGSGRNKRAMALASGS